VRSDDEHHITGGGGRGGGHRSGLSSGVLSPINSSSERLDGDDGGPVFDPSEDGEIMSGRVHVSVRMRGPEGGPKASTLQWDCQSQQVFVNKINPRDQTPYKFNHVFGPGASQAELYLNIGRPLVEDVLGGYTGTILCYGQTGSGKTYTMIAPQVSVNT
jgi:hypothetical protein